MVERAGIKATPMGVTSVVPQPSGSGAGAFADTMDALGREADGLRQRLQPIANKNAQNQAAKAAEEGNFNQKMTLVQEDEAYNNVVESAYHAKMATDVEVKVAELVRDHPIGEPVETLKAQIDAAKRTYLKQAPSAYAMSTGQKWDQIATRASIAVADAQKRNAIKNAAENLNARLEMISDKLSNATDLNAPDVLALRKEADDLVLQLSNPLYGLPTEKLKNARSEIDGKIVMRGLMGSAEGIYDAKGLDAARDYIFGVRKRTDIPLSDSQRDSIVNEAWSNIKFKDAQIKAEKAQARMEARQQQSLYKQELAGRMQDAIMAFERGIVFEGAPSIADIEATFGPAKAALYEQAMGGAPLMAELKTATSAELTGILNEPPPDASQPGSREAFKMYDQRQKAAGRLLKDRQSDPMKAHIESGLVDRGDISSALKSEAGLRIFMRSRAVAAMEAGADYGTKPAPLTKAEAAAFGTYLDSLDGKSRAQFMAGVSNAMGKEGAPAYRQMVRMLKPQSAAFTQAGMVLSIDGQVGKYDSERASEIIINGDALLNPSKADKEATGKIGFAMPKEDELSRIWQKETGKAYAGMGTQQSMAYQTFRAAYAGLAADAGEFSGEMNRDIAKEAAKIASGGVGKWGNQDVILPWGMSESEFQNRIARGWPTISAGHPELKGTRPEDWGLQQFADGGYYLTRGNRPAMATSGVPIKLWVRK